MGLTWDLIDHIPKVLLKLHNALKCLSTPINDRFIKVKDIVQRELLSSYGSYRAADTDVLFMRIKVTFTGGSGFYLAYNVQMVTS
ncbi:MAG: hypothetical protein ACK5G7_00335 [Erysipelotrichaceae bacterium]